MMASSVSFSVVSVRVCTRLDNASSKGSISATSGLVSANIPSEFGLMILTLLLLDKVAVFDAVDMKIGLQARSSRVDPLIEATH